MRKTGLELDSIDRMIAKLDKMLMDNPKDPKLIKKAKRGLEDVRQWRSQQRNAAEKHS